MNLPADTQELIATVISRVVTLLIAFTIHELAHAVVADRMGDHTARYAGRITLMRLFSGEIHPDSTCYNR